MKLLMAMDRASRARSCSVSQRVMPWKISAPAGGLIMLISAEKPKSQAATKSPKIAAAVMMLQALLEAGLAR